MAPLMPGDQHAETIREAAVKVANERAVIDEVEDANKEGRLDFKGLETGRLDISAVAQNGARITKTGRFEAPLEQDLEQDPEVAALQNAIRKQIVAFAHRELETIRKLNLVDTTEVVTAEQAKIWMERHHAAIARLRAQGTHFEQRPQSKPLIRKLNDLILAMEFVCTPARIAISPEGLIIDGQHRLEAVILSGTAACLKIERGWPRSIFAFLDQGKKRTNADAAATLGVGDPKHVTNALRLVNNYDLMGDKRLKPTGRAWDKAILAHHMEGLIQRYEGIGEFVTIARRVAKEVKVSIPGFAAALYLIAREWPQGPHMDFVRELETGAMMQSGAPALELRNFLFRMAVARRNSVLQSRDVPVQTMHFCVIIDAWNARCAGKNMGNFNVRGDRYIPRAHAA